MHLFCLWARASIIYFWGLVVCVEDLGLENFGISILDIPP